MSFLGPRERLWPRVLAVGIVVMAIGARLAFIATTSDYRSFADAADYDRVAVSLATEGQYPPSQIAPSGGPDALRPPGYPFLLAFAYRVTGTAHSASRVVVGRVLNALLGAAVVAQIMLIAGVLWGEVAAIVAGLIAVAYPPFVTAGVSLLSEPLFTVLALGAVAAVLAARRARAPMRWIVLAGVLLGLAVLTRVNGSVIALPLAAGVGWRTGRRPAALAPIIVLLLTAALVIAPWCVRDASAFHRFVAISTQDGFTLAGTYNSVSAADPHRPAAWRVPLMAPYRGLLRPRRNEAVLDGEFRSAAVSYAEGHPAYVARVLFWNSRRMLGIDGGETEQLAASENGIGARTARLDVLSFYLLGVLAILALIAGGWRGAPGFLWWVPILIALSLVFVTVSMRYRMPIDPFLVLLVAGGAQRLIRKRRVDPVSR